MSDGLSWYADHLKGINDYEDHKKSEKFSKDYLEADIVEKLTPKELHLLVTRLIIHHLGGFSRFFSEQKVPLLEIFTKMPKKKKEAFLMWANRESGMTFEPKKKMELFKKKAKELLNTLED